MPYELHLAQILGAHLENIEDLSKLREALGLLQRQDIAILCFEGVVTLSPSFATALLLEVRSFRRANPNTKVRMTSLTIQQRATLDRSRLALEEDK